MSGLMAKLGRRQQKGSKPRCHWLTHGSAGQVAARLTKLIEPWGHVSETDCWLPDGFRDVKEAQLHNASALLEGYDDDLGYRLQRWWFAVASAESKSPNWDIASPCTVTVGSESKPGLLLVEAKAHSRELNDEITGKELREKVTANACRNHVRIAACIQEANLALMDQTDLRWALSHEWCYQMSNRFTWSWKLTELDIPVILVYLGFLNAEEMRKGKKQEPFVDHAAWEALVKSHSHPLIPEEAWNKPCWRHCPWLVPLIRSMDIPYDRPSAAAEA